jgi:hypothetical protein
MPKNPSSTLCRGCGWRRGDADAIIEAGSRKIYTALRRPRITPALTRTGICHASLNAALAAFVTAQCCSRMRLWLNCRKPLPPAKPPASQTPGLTIANNLKIDAGRHRPFDR